MTNAFNFSAWKAKEGKYEFEAPLSTEQVPGWQGLHGEILSQKLNKK